MAVSTRPCSTGLGPCGAGIRLGRPLRFSFQFEGLLEFGGVHEVLGTAGGPLRGEKVFQAEEIDRRVADVDGSAVPPTGSELQTRDALEDVDSVGGHTNDEEV